MHPPSLTSLLIILVIVILLFGTKKLKNLGSDLGAALRSFKTAIKETDEEESTPKAVEAKPGSAETEAKTPNEKV